MRIVLICGLTIAYSILVAQSPQSLLLIDPQSQDSISKKFCNPGIANKSRSRGLEITYNLSGGGLIEEEGAEGEEERVLGHMKTQESFTLKIRVPVLLRKDFKVLIGYDYQPERYRFGNVDPEIMPLVGDLNDRLLKSNGFDVFVTKSLSDKLYTAFRFKIGFNGDYDGWIDFDRQYATYNGIGLLGFKKSDDFEWGAGVVYSQNMRRTLVLPFVMLNKNFNDKWGIETAPPAYLLGRYNINPRNILLFGAEYKSRMYAISPNSISFIQNRPNPTYNHAEFNAVVSLEKQIVPWIWFNLKAGYQFNLNSRYETQVPGSPTLSIRPPDAPFVQFGIFLSPPDKLMK